VGNRKEERRENVCADEITKQLQCSEGKNGVAGHGEKRKSKAEIKKIVLNHN
jgi:hypothetical protein